MKGEKFPDIVTCGRGKRWIRYITWISLSVLVPLLIGCAAGCNTSPSPMGNNQTKIILTEQDSGRSIDIPPRGILIIKLRATPGTGYSWNVKEYDKEPIKLLGTSVEEIGEAKPGASHFEIFTFRANASGSTSIRLEYVRVWEKDIPPMKVFQVVVNVR